MATKVFKFIKDKLFVDSIVFIRNNVIEPLSKLIIIDYGSNSNGSYIKYGNGDMICYKTINVSSNITNRWGNMYESTSAVSLGNWPVEFKDTPTINVNKTTGQGSWLQLINGLSKTSCGNTYFVSAVSSSVTTNLNIIGIGKWK